MTPAYISGVIEMTEMVHDNSAENAMLEAACTDAQEFLLTYPWCHGFGEVYFGGGVGGIVAIFLMSIYPIPTGADEWVWVIVGDVPPAYLMLHQCPTPAEALKCYIAMMQEWVDLAVDGFSSESVIPVNMEPIPENARLLQARLDVLATTIVPRLEDGPTVH